MFLYLQHGVTADNLAGSLGVVVPPASRIADNGSLGVLFPLQLRVTADNLAS